MFLPDDFSLDHIFTSDSRRRRRRRPLTMVGVAIAVVIVLSQAGLEIYQHDHPNEKIMPSLVSDRSTSTHQNPFMNP